MMCVVVARCCVLSSVVFKDALRRLRLCCHRLGRGCGALHGAGVGNAGVFLSTHELPHLALGAIAGAAAVFLCLQKLIIASTLLTKLYRSSSLCSSSSSSSSFSFSFSVCVPFDFLGGGVSGGRGVILVYVFPLFDETPQTEVIETPTPATASPCPRPLLTLHPHHRRLAAYIPRPLNHCPETKQRVNGLGSRRLGSSVRRCWTGRLLSRYGYGCVCSAAAAVRDISNDASQRNITRKHNPPPPLLLLVLRSMRGILFIY